MKPVPPAQKLLFKTRGVRIWEMTVEPDHSYPFHRHMHPYFSVVLEGATLILIDERGKPERLHLRAGDVVWKPRPDAHLVRNVGRTRFRNRLIELVTSRGRTVGKH
jgi:quercetin dioxygenase-like cupin family protein